MNRTIRIDRWSVELYQRAIYIQQGANPQCRDCEGTGAVEFHVGWPPEPEYDHCACWDPTTSTRIPLWRRAAVTEPF